MLLVLLTTAACLSDFNVLTSHYDRERTGANTQESVLKVSNVRPGTFGKLFSIGVDGDVYAQPLYAGSVDFGELGRRNAVYIATMHNTLYALDADTGEEIWRFNAGQPVPAYLYHFNDIGGEVGILSTPVIDLASGTIFLVSNNYEEGTFSYHLHALDMVTGQARADSPNTIEASVEGRAPDAVNGQVPFRPFDHLQRPGLALSGGVVYIGFGSHADDGPYHGWLIGYDAEDINRRVTTFNVTPDGEAGSLWHGGRAPAIDNQGNLYVVAANGDYTGARNFGESVLKLRTSPEITVDSWFTPADWEQLNATDFEIGSSGAVLMPGDEFVIAGGKRGVVHVLRTGNLNGLDRPADPTGQSQTVSRWGIFTMALWSTRSDGVLYVRGVNTGIKAYRIRKGTMDAAPSSESKIILGVPYQGMAVSSNGSREDSGIVWVATAEDVFRAFRASDLEEELWSSDMDEDHDGLGSFAKFATPTVANGKVYVPTFSGRVQVYGLLDDPCSPPRPPGE